MKSLSAWFEPSRAVGDFLSLSLLVPFTLLQCSLPARANGAVTTCSESDLRSALSGGGVVNLACDGVIALSGPLIVTADTVLDATGHAVTLSGNGLTRLFVVRPGVTLALHHLTLADGMARGTNSTESAGQGGPATGGAILNDHGFLEVNGCIFRNNHALGGTGGPGGTFPTNRGGDGLGGAIFNDSGTVRLTDVVFDRNSVQGGQGGTAPPVSPSKGGNGGISFGGAVYSHTGIVTVASCRFVSNSAPASLPGPANGFNPSSAGALGGAIYNFFGILQITGSRFENQFCGGGDAFCTGSGGAIYQAGGLLSVTDTIFSMNRVVGGNGIIIGVGGNSGSAYGGAMYLTSVSPPNQDDPPLLGLTGITNSLFVGNEVQGGIQAPAFSPAGYGYGGALYNGGHLTMVNCTLTANTAGGGAIVEAGYPLSSAYGGAIYCWNARATSVLTHVTMARNQARVGPGAGGGSEAQGGGIFVSSGLVRTRNSILAENAPGRNCMGVLSDDGNNLSSDGSCAFTQPGSLNNTDPLLLPLANYGGPTLTIGLAGGSPAIDAGKPDFCPATDQRGVLRPQHGACDIGAFEATFASIRRGPTGELQIEHVGVPHQPCALLLSINLTDWVQVGLSAADDVGRALFMQPNLGNTAVFFQVTFP